MSLRRVPRPPPARGREILSLGGRIHTVVGAMILAVTFASLAVAVASRHGFPFDAIPLVPARVYSLELWRLVTWTLVEVSPIALLFAVLFLFWFGGDLSVAWGPRRFVRVVVELALAVGAITCLLALVDPDVMSFEYLGTLALSSGLVVAWGLVHPEREIRLYFVLPVTGRGLVAITVFLTVAYGAYFGWQVVVPDLAAEALMALYVLRPKPPKRPPSGAQKRVPRVEIGRRGHIRLVDND